MMMMVFLQLLVRLHVCLSVVSVYLSLYLLLVISYLTLMIIFHFCNEVSLSKSQLAYSKHLYVPAITYPTWPVRKCVVRNDFGVSTPISCTLKSLLLSISLLSLMLAKVVILAFSFRDPPMACMRHTTPLCSSNLI